jgi:hypothetical protein
LIASIKASHPEYGNHHAPGQEAALPDRVHVLEHGGIDHRVVERERNLEHAQHQADPQGRGNRAQGARSARPYRSAGGKSQPAAQGQADCGEEEAAPEIFDHFCISLGRR